MFPGSWFPGPGSPGYRAKQRHDLGSLAISAGSVPPRAIYPFPSLIGSATRSPVPSDGPRQADRQNENDPSNWVQPSILRHPAVFGWITPFGDCIAVLRRFDELTTQADRFHLRAGLTTPQVHVGGSNPPSLAMPEPALRRQPSHATKTSSADSSEKPRRRPGIRLKNRER